MKTIFRLFSCLLFLASYTIHSQVNIKDYEMQWEGKLQHENTFNFKVSIDVLGNNKYHLKIYNNQFTFNKTLTSTTKKHIQFNIDDAITFSGNISKNNSEISGFINSGIYLYHVQLLKTTNNNYVGTWNIFLLEKLISNSIFLSIENVQGKQFDAYPFFGDRRFAGTWCMNSKRKNTTITFQDAKTGLRFRGELGLNKITLNILFVDKVIATTILSKTKDEWVFEDFNSKISPNYIPKQLNDGWNIGKLKNHTLLQKMEDNIVSKKLEKTHSVLIAKKGKLIYEKYFSGFTSATPHDQRSASKSISSALIGIAIDKRLIKNDNQPVYDFIPKKYQYTKKGKKSIIKIKDLLTMSSGIDAVDFGIKRKSLASEPSYQNSKNWLKTVLEAPMINTPGTVANYGSANPYLLGVALNEVISKPLELFIDQELLQPLGISNYIIQREMTGKPYFGGGMYITPRDMLKFGQLYLNKGKWKGQRIISRKWVQKSFQNYLQLKNTKEKNGYGYLWWHKTYTVNGKQIKSIEARGNGGQYIFVVPKLKLVTVITSGNYRNGKTQQPEKIFEKYILPTILGN
mgnify:CR=1 FL=1